MTAIPETFGINRDVEKGIHRVTEIFRGLYDSPALAEQFETEKDVKEFLDHATVRVARSDGYMYVDPWDGSVVINLRYLVRGDKRDLYLDIIHELVHVRQRLQGKDLYDRQYDYIERPTEREAYSIVVREAKRIGMTREEILEYLEVPWISKKELQLMAQKLGIEI